MTTLMLPDPDGRTAGIPHFTEFPGWLNVTAFDKKGRAVAPTWSWPLADERGWGEWDKPKQVLRIEVRIDRGPFSCRYLADTVGDGTWACDHCGQKGDIQLSADAPAPPSQARA